MLQRIGIVGGTGKFGRGIGARLAIAGVSVALASRDAARGREAGAALAEECGGEVTGGDASVLDAVDAVILAVPFDGLEANLQAVAGHVEDRIVVSAVNPMAFDDIGPYPVTVPEGSAAALVADRLAGARVVSAFHSVASRTLGELERPMDDDVPVFGDIDEDVAAVVGLIDRIDGCRGVAAGPLRLSHVAESLTPVLISVNRRYRAHVGFAFTRLSTD